jgi:hypothetical protein
MNSREGVCGHPMVSGSYRLIWLVTVVGLMLLWEPAVSAQMFGTRNLGQNPLGRTRSLMEELEQRGFGTLQRAPGGPRPNPLARDTRWSGSRTPLQPPPTFRLERALPAPAPTVTESYGSMARRGRIYPPRIQVAFPTNRGDMQTRAEWLTRQLQEQLHLSPEESVQVQLEGGTAILRGEVASDRAKSLARLLVLFEPGIDQVDDSQLLVRRVTEPSGQKPLEAERSADLPPDSAKAAAEDKTGPRSPTSAAPVSDSAN